MQWDSEDTACRKRLCHCRALQAERIPFEEYELSDQVEASAARHANALPTCNCVLPCPLPPRASPASQPARRAARSAEGHLRRQTRCCTLNCLIPHPHLPLQVLARIKAATGQATVPQIFVGGQLLGGASELLPLLQDGSLQRRLVATAAPPLPAELQQLLQAAAAAVKPAAGPAVGAAEDGERARLQQLASELCAALAAGAAHTFTLQQAAQWLQQAKGEAPDAAAAALGQLQVAQLLVVAEPAGHADAELPLSAQLVQQRPQLLLRLAADAPPPERWSEPLNGQYAWFGPARPAEEVRACMAPSNFSLLTRLQRTAAAPAAPMHPTLPVAARLLPPLAGGRVAAPGHPAAV